MRQGRQLPGRIDGLDLARFLALAGMMGTHLWLEGQDGRTPPLVAVLEGKASALFAVLAGVGIALTSARGCERGDVWAARMNLLGRGLALIAIGLTLGQLNPAVLIILAFYGTMFVLAMPLLRVRTRTLLIAAAIWAVVWPPFSQLLRFACGCDDRVTSPDWFSLANPVALLIDLLLTGAYPAITWMSYLMLGLAIGRALISRRGEPLRTRRLARWLLGAGAGLALLSFLVARAQVELFAARLLGRELGVRDDAMAVQIGREELEANAYGTSSIESPWYLFSMGPHTGTPADLLITGSIAAAVIGACLLVGASLGPHGRLALMPVLGAGAAPLTVYSAHVVGVVLSRAAASGISGSGGSAPIESTQWLFSSPQLWALHLAGALLIGVTLRIARVRGPLEALVTLSGRALASFARGQQDTVKPSS